MSCYGAKIGDVVIANELANSGHVFTKEGWIGVIKNINSFGELIAEGKYPNGDNEGEFVINSKCFDFYPLTTAQKLAQQLGFSNGGFII